VVDISSMNRILATDTDDMTVHVEAGVSWAALDAALAPLGVRTPFWGTGSGRHATVGGTLSQNANNYGSGHHGFAAENVIGLRVVLADGGELSTGLWAAATSPDSFARHYGPDLTGLFIGDCGALGIKIEATLPLVRRPGAVEYCSYEYGERDAFLAAISAAGRAGLHAECFGFDPAYLDYRTTYAGVSEDWDRLKGVLTGQGSVLKGIAAAVRVAAAGRRHFEGAGYTLHFTVEGRDDRDAASALARLRTLCAPGAREIPASVPRIMRGTPFPAPTIMLGPRGERWIPVHGIVPHSRVQAALEAIQAAFNANAASIDRHDIAWAWVAMPVGRSGILIEPTIYWSDRRTPMQDRYLDASYAAKNDAHQPNLEARRVVEALRNAVAAAFRSVGAVHMQIGRTYPWHDSRMPTARDIMQPIKRHLDPAGLMNPGSLGLP
jgi:FAD/FMN-containing dehydrogenase